MFGKTVIYFFLLMSLVFMAGCIGETRDENIDTYFEFYYNGDYVSIPGGYDYDHPDFGDFICAWIYYDDVEHIYKMKIDATREDDSEYFVFTILGDADGVYEDYYDLNDDAQILYFYDPVTYNSSSGYVRLTYIEPVDGVIEGEFEGIFVPETSGSNVDITDGIFRALRISEP